MKKIIAALSCLAVLTSMLAGCSSDSASAALPNTASVDEVRKNVAATPATLTVPKYVFMFIGDGMSYPQFQSASDYLGAVAEDKQTDKILNGGEMLSFMQFPVAGSANTYDSTSFAPDSASTATSLATGHKTYSGVINMDETKTKSYETIAEKLKEQLGYKVGIISSVNLNHATPAAYYAHQASRNNYYEIGMEMITSGFDYFAGGALIQPTGSKKDKQDLYKLAELNNYKVIKTQAEAAKLTAKDGRAIVIGETLADGDALSYDNDRKSGEWALKDYVSKGIEVLNNDKGFFMMVEGGKIDWACHANDAGSTIADTLALDAAVQEAVKFYEQHPAETLILVTGDHETGGLTIGYAGTNYDTYLSNLTNQKISYAKFDSAYVAKYKKDKTSFATVLNDVEKLFGLTLEGNVKDGTDKQLILTNYEFELLEAAYDRTMTVGTSSQSKMTQAEYQLYGTYEPLTVTVTHILNNKSGIGFTSYSHTGLPVAVFAQGAGADQFKGYYDNTEVYTKLAALTQVK